MGDHYLYGRALSDFANKWHKYPVENAESAYENITDLQVIFDLTYINTDSLKNTKRMFKGVIFRELWLHEAKFAEVEDASSMFEDASLSSADFWIDKWTFENTKNFSKMFKNFNINYFRNNNGTIKLNKAEDLSEMFMGANAQNSLFNDGIPSGGEYIRTMESMYENYKGSINVGLDGLNITKATNIKNMFKNAKVLTITLPKIFNTLATTDMSSLFENCTNLTALKNFDQIDTDNVTNMSKMFYNTPNYKGIDQVAKSIKASNVTDMSYMFSKACANDRIIFNPGFTTNSVTTMQGMFEGICPKNVDISHFRFDNLKDMSRMFKGVFEVLTADSIRDHYIGRADSYSYGVTDVIWPSRHTAPKLETMARLFQSNRFIRKVKAPSLNTPALKDLSWAFYGIGSFNEFDVSGLDTSNVEDFSHIFALNEEGFKNFESIKLNFNTSKATNLQEIFFYTWYPKNLDLSSWNTSNVTNMLECFGMTRNTVDELDLTGWNTAKVTNMDYFLYESNIKKIWASDTFVTTSVTSASQPLYNANIQGQKGTNGYNGDYSYLRIDNAPTAPGIFWKKS